jgi:hypothetical protein
MTINPLPTQYLTRTWAGTFRATCSRVEIVYGKGCFGQLSPSQSNPRIEWMKEERAEIVKSGTWLYGGSINYEVWIVRQNFEYYYEQDFDEAERLNSEGEMFVVIYAQAGQIIGGAHYFLTMAEAIAAAERGVPQGITWNDQRIQPLYGGPTNCGQITSDRSGYHHLSQAKLTMTLYDPCVIAPLGR